MRTARRSERKVLPRSRMGPLAQDFGNPLSAGANGSNLSNVEWFEHSKRRVQVIVPSLQVPV